MRNKKQRKIKVPFNFFYQKKNVVLITEANNSKKLPHLDNFPVTSVPGAIHSFQYLQL